MKEILLKLVAHHTLTRDEAREALLEIGNGKVNPSQTAAFLTVFLMRIITVEELTGFRDALLELCIHTDLGDFQCIDLCGTGGDGKNTFNISTLASFVVAGAGGKVAKHGNYGVSSASGSSNMLEYFGYKFSNDRSKLLNELDKAGICFLHAPLFHPAMKHVGPIRKELGMKTFFNILGPIVNPSFPEYQISGVFNLETARLYKYVLQESARKYRIIYSLDGYDEISLTGNVKIISETGEELLEPEDFNSDKLKEEELYGGGNVEEAAKIFRNVLEGNGTEAQNKVVISNAGMALHCLDSGNTLSECISMATESIESGKARQAFTGLMELNT